MTTAQNVETITLEAGSAIDPYRFVTLASDGQVDHTGSTLRPDGVSAQAAAAAGDQLAVAQLQAIMKVEAGAAVSVGALVGSDADGKAVAAGTALDNYSAGVALDEATADGEVIRVLLHSPDRAGGAS